MSSHRSRHKKNGCPQRWLDTTTVGLLGMKAHQLFVHHVRMFYIWHPKYITVVRLKWSSFNKHMGQTAQVRKGPEMNLPRLPCRHPSIQENASIGFRWFQPLRMVSCVFVLQACFLSKLWVKAEQRSAHAVCSFCLEHGFQHSWSSSMIRCIHCNLGIPTYPTALFVKSEFPQAWQKNSSSHLEYMSRMDIHWVEVKKPTVSLKQPLPTPNQLQFLGPFLDSWVTCHLTPLANIIIFYSQNKWRNITTPMLERKISIPFWQNSHEIYLESPS